MVGVIAIVAGTIATVLSALSFGLPMWSSNRDVFHNVTTTKDVKLSSSAKLAVGVWGICTDFKASINNDNDEVDGGNCYLYYTSSEVQTLQAKVDGDDRGVNIVTETESLCDYYQNKTAFSVDLSIIPSSFFEDTCGAMGKSTLAFSAMAASFSVIMLALLLLGVTCCKKNNLFVRLASKLASLCLLFTIISIVLWAIQSKDLNDTDKTNFGVSFYFAIISAVFFIITATYGHKHALKGVEEQRQQGTYAMQRTPRTPDAHRNKPTAGTGTNLV